MRLHYTQGTCSSWSSESLMSMVMRRVAARNATQVET